MHIRQIDTENRRDVRQFIRFPFELYRFCAQWVPPLLSSVQTDLSRQKHPYYRHSTADFFVAESQDQTLGRIAVMENRRYNEYHDRKAAFFGFFEVVEDLEVARALFEATFEWARARGLNEMMGPKGLIGSDGGGVLVKGFEHRPAMGAAYNLPYYDDFLQNVGIKKDRDLLSAHLGRSQQDLPERMYKAVEKLRKRRGLAIKGFHSREEMRDWVPRLLQAHSEAFSQNYTYYPPTPEETQMVVDTVLTVADPRLIKLVLKNEKIVGFILLLPDITAGLQKARGRIWPFGWFHIWREQRRTTSVSVPALGILPEYQGSGANAVLYVELAKILLPSRFTDADLMQIDEHNFRSLREVRNMEVIWHKTHRLYKMAL